MGGLLYSPFFTPAFCPLPPLCCASSFPPPPPPPLPLEHACRPLQTLLRAVGAAAHLSGHRRRRLVLHRGPLPLLRQRAAAQPRGAARHAAVGAIQGAAHEVGVLQRGVRTQVRQPTVRGPGTMAPSLGGMEANSGNLYPLSAPHCRINDRGCSRRQDVGAHGPRLLSAHVG